MTAPSVGWKERALRLRSTPGVLLMAAVVSGLVLANLLPNGRLQRFWNDDFGGRLGPLTISESLTTVTIEGLMTAFFLVVGLEIKREIVSGSLKSIRTALTPVLCAVGGMLVPALVYLLVNRSEVTSVGWGTPTATDVALAVTVLILVAPGISPGARAFLLALAVADDIGGIAVIWIWYSRGARITFALAAVGVVLVAAAAMNHGLVRLPYALLSIVPAWLLLRLAHVEPAIIGALFGLLAPLASTSRAPTAADDANRMLQRISPVVSWGVLPLFGAISASISVNTSSVDSRVIMGVALALCIGKPLGIFGTALLLRRTRIGELPEGMNRAELLGVAMLAGVGLTVSFYIARTSFSDENLRSSAAVGVLVGSSASILVGGCYFASHRIRSRRVSPDALRQ